LYGAFIIDPKGGRPPVDRELVMVMSGFDVDFDDVNDFYAVNGIPFHYQMHPIQIRVGETVRVYLVNILEYDLINSFHLHANFFNYYPTGTSLTPSEFTDTIMQTQAQRGILEFSYKYPGLYMFHAHNTEFAELELDGNFEGSP
jgi:FtsP/CotA-like multicopper oxidase with cupredoxin domain